MVSLSRGYWITVALVYLAAYVVVVSWAFTTENPRILWWATLLSFAAYGSWRFRHHPQLARWSGVAPVVVILATGLAGRWSW